MAAFDVVVCGSLHYDIVVNAPRLPELDETLPGSAWQPVMGGKGRNQAVAAAKAGARTAMIGSLGRDDFGDRLRSDLVAAGVDGTSIATLDDAETGMSVAIVDAAGDYGAVIVSGANLRIDPDTAARSLTMLGGAVVVLLQNEIPKAVNVAVAEAARETGARVVLNAAPARQRDGRLAARVDVLVVNRVEAEVLAGARIDSPGAALSAGRGLADNFPEVVVTLGADGYVVAGGDRAEHFPAADVVPVSSHGAGDAFCGVLATSLAQGALLADGARIAADAAALWVATPVADRGTLRFD